MKKQKDKIVAQIERYCKKKLVFARPLLPFGTVREAHPQTTHLATPTHKLTLLLPKELFFLPTLGAIAKVCCIFRVLNFKLTGDKY